MLDFMFGFQAGRASVPPPPIPTGPSGDMFRLLERRIDNLELACAGLWQHLKNQHGYSDEQLVQVITEIDSRDGKVDGRMRTTGQTCPKCGRPMLTKDRGKCLWCGAELPKAPF